MPLVCYFKLIIFSTNVEHLIITGIEYRHPKKPVDSLLTLGYIALFGHATLSVQAGKHTNEALRQPVEVWIHYLTLNYKKKFRWQIKLGYSSSHEMGCCYATLCVSSWLGSSYSSNVRITWIFWCWWCCKSWSICVFGLHVPILRMIFYGMSLQIQMSLHLWW